MHRINTTQPTLSGDAIASQVMEIHSTHLPSVQSMALLAFLTRRLETCLHANRIEQNSPDI